MAVLKSGPWQVFVHYGQVTRSHSQHEALNFSAFFGDTDVTHDPGTVGYGSPLHSGYYTRGLNHNVPLINGEGQESAERGELREYGARPARIAVAQPKYRATARAERVLAIEGNTLIDTASIASTKGAQRLGLALHLQGKVRLPATFQPVEDLAKDRPAAFGYWRGVRAAEFRDRAELDVDYGNGVVMRVPLTAPGEFRLWRGSAPDVPPRRRESLYLELVTPAEGATFTTTMAPAKR